MDRGRLWGRDNVLPVKVVECRRLSRAEIQVTIDTGLGWKVRSAGSIVALYSDVIDYGDLINIQFN